LPPSDYSEHSEEFVSCESMNMNSCQVNTGYHSPLQFPSKTSWPDLSGKWRLYRVHEIPPMSISPCLMALSQTASTSFSPVSFALTRIVLMRPRLCANTALKKPVRTSIPSTRCPEAMGSDSWCLRWCLRDSIDGQPYPPKTRRTFFKCLIGPSRRLSITRNRL